MRIAFALAIVSFLMPAPLCAQTVVYQGQLVCEVAAGGTRPSQAPVTITRTGSQVLFERAIYQEGTREIVGRESGTGTLSGGQFRIETEGSFGAQHMGRQTVRGRYEGTLTDGEVRIRGTRDLVTQRRGMGTQSCTGTFRAQGR
ncbi:hypothetical protein [Elioraea rosea]|uniref:hypothetical protein n=1 Tax=Elioraea rosea TaxID=2492390 RepID=UPI0011860297|nr:hypothetical protein [Elioraea rosea]